MQTTLHEIQLGTKTHNVPVQIPIETYRSMKDAYPNSLDYIPQYVFNNALLKEFEGIEYSPFRIPCIFGYVFISTPQMKPGFQCEFYLISRKDCRRPGRRFVTRGVDLDGCVANFVESEHVFVVSPSGSSSVKIASFV